LAQHLDFALPIGIIDDMQTRIAITLKAKAKGNTPPGDGRVRVR
jgi:hypothetical protein